MRAMHTYPKSRLENVVECIVGVFESGQEGALLANKSQVATEYTGCER